MDNLIPVLWLLFMLAVTVIPAISKARQAAKKAANTQKAPVLQHEAVKPHPEYRKQGSKTPIESALQAAHVGMETSFQQIENTYAEPENTDLVLSEESETVDFDLRKAVIYSEILKPKFNE